MNKGKLEVKHCSSESQIAVVLAKVLKTDRVFLSKERTRFNCLNDRHSNTWTKEACGV